jgi:Xaa-Pro aminopeptidase
MTNISERLKKLRRLLAGKNVEALLVSNPDNRRYLSGFDGSAGFLLITQKDNILATDSRYLEQGGRQASEYEILESKGELAGWLPTLVDRLGLKELHFEAEHLTFAAAQRLKKSLASGSYGPKLIPADGLVETLRAVKGPAEIELITRAAQMCDAAFEHILGLTMAGMTEEEVAWELERFLRERGSQPLPFDVIVASGPNSALPHARPTDRPISPGEPVLIDFGARVDGYSSDISRTICLGQADATYRRVYSAVLTAQLAALDGIKAGMSGQQADAVAREAIEKAGYGDNFGHGLGHGLGLAIHETPRLGPGLETVLADGMVFTIEPGIYLTGWGGVRIEDTVVMECGRIKVLSQAGK